MANFIQYGDRRLDMGDLTLDQAKQIMARHFPELADPKVDNKTAKNGDVVYTFTKKAGRKGAPQNAPSPLAMAFEQLATLPEMPIVPDGFLEALLVTEDAYLDPELFDFAERNIEREITQVQHYSQALADIPALAIGGTVL